MRSLHIGESRDVSQYFDGHRPGFPSLKYVEHSIQLFFDNLSSQFLFLHREAVRRAWAEQTMSAPFANSLAALGLRYVPLRLVCSSVRQIFPLRFSQSDVGASQIHLGDPFLDMAKDLIVPALYTPSVEVLHSLLLLAWAEYGCGRESGLHLYNSVRFRQ